MTAGATGQSTEAVAETIPYGEHADQVVEVFHPSGAASGVLVVLLHGGFWAASVDRGYLRPMARGLADAGHTVVLPEFRRVDSDGGWPHTLDDVAQAVDRASQLVADHSGVPARLRATVVVGHSSGGQLAAWCAGRANLPAESTWAQQIPSLTGAVVLSGAVDLRLSAEMGLGEGATARFLDGTPTEIPERYRQADPALLRPAVPVVLLHPAGDPVVPVSLAESYAAAAAVAGGSAQLRILRGDDHFLTTTPEAAAWAHVLAAIDDVSR